jgi:Tol biopolymer transport system component
MRWFSPRRKSIAVRRRWLSILVLFEWTVIAVLSGGLIYFVVSSGHKLANSIATSEPIRAVYYSVKSTLNVPQSPTADNIFPTTTSRAETTNLFVTPVHSSEFLPTSQPTYLEKRLAGRIVFTCTPEKFNQLCLMNADGSGQVRLTDRKSNDYYPSFSSDGRSVAFVSNQTGQFEIFLMDLRNSDERQVTSGMGNVSAPDISPDGRWIVYASKLGGDSSIWLIPFEGGTPQSLTDTSWNEVDPVWSPDGKQIAFAGARGGFVELFTVSVETLDFREISILGDDLQIRQVTQDVSGIGGRSSWSPDGSKLVFYAGPRGERNIYVVDVVTGVSAQLTFGGNNTGPCVSPDGEWIAFSSSRDGDHEIYLMRKDGTDVTQLTDNSYDDWQPSWGP